MKYETVTKDGLKVMEYLNDDYIANQFHTWCLDRGEISPHKSTLIAWIDTNYPLINITMKGVDSVFNKVHEIIHGGPYD